MENQSSLHSKHMPRLESQTLAKRIYSACPWYVQNVFVSAYGLILMQRLTSPEVKKHLAIYMQTQWLSKTELHRYQSQKLSALIHHAYQHVPYYHKLFDSLHLGPDDILEPADLQKLPLLTKQDVRNHLNELFATNINRRKMNAMSTSGTTGSPITVYVTSQNAATERALNLRMRTWAGWSVHERRATFTGYSVVPQGPQPLPWWRQDWPEHRLFLSPYHMTHANMGQYIEAIRAFQPKVIEGYPSYISFLAQELEARNEMLPVQAVFTSSETLFPYQRQVIEERFGKIFDWYGLTERAASAAQCEQTDGYHVNAEKTIVEIVRPDGSPAAPGEYGEIVGTNLEEFGMPLIRYCSGDVSALREQTCACGRNLPLIEQIQTRVDDIITTSDGRLINPAPLAGLFRSHSIDRGRIIQEDLMHYTVKIVPISGYSKAESAKIIKGMHAVLGADIQIRVDLVESIPCQGNGKYPFIISKIRAAQLREQAHGN